MKVYENCQEVREEFSALLDGELAVDEQDGVEQHLSGCAECLRELDGLKRVNDLYDGLPAVNAPEEFTIKVTEEESDSNVVDLKSAARDTKPMSFRPLFAAAAMLALLASVSYLASQQMNRPESMEMAASAPAVEADEAAGELASEAVLDELESQSTFTEATGDDAPLAEEVQIDPPAASEVPLESRVANQSAGDAAFEAEPPAAPPAPAPAADSNMPELADADVGSAGAGGASAAQSTQEVTGRRESLQKAAPTLESLGFTKNNEGTWVEEDYDDAATTTAAPGSDTYRMIVEKRPELVAHLVSGNDIILNVDGTWYRVELPSPE